jgi:hypothetical protein
MNDRSTTIINILLACLLGALMCALLLGTANAATTNEIGKVVLINDAGQTRPAQSIATPAQVTALTEASSNTLASATAIADPAINALAIAQAAFDRTTLYSTNFHVTSTVYVQSIGGVPYDPSNQTIRVYSVALVSTNVVITGTLAQDPLVDPVLDWRQSFNGGAWSNITATVTEVDIPAGVTNAAAAYQFTLPKPHNTQAFFRIVDNSTGASGSGLYWLVFGGIYVDGRKGATTTLTNVVGSVTNTWPVVGGIVVDPVPL